MDSLSVEAIRKKSVSKPRNRPRARGSATDRGSVRVGPEAEERGPLQPREVGLAGVVLVEDDEVERGRVRGVEEAGPKATVR